MKSRILCVAIALVPALAMGAAPMTYPAVTGSRLEHPEPENWLVHRGNYAGWGYSPLEQINASNVEKLTLAWSFATGLADAHESTPMVNGSYMFVTAPGNEVIALNAKTGDQLWRYKHPIPEGLFQLHPTNRGVALYEDKVFMATVDCRLVALDAKSGVVAWSVPIDDYKTGCYSTLAPLAAKGKILVGYSGGEMSVRGSISAFDAHTGKRLWRTYTIPAPDEPGGHTWEGSSHQMGGGSVWITGTYEPSTNITYWGTGNPAPWVADGRKGDNLYTDSTLALDLETGAIKGYHQYTPHDSFDWDEVSAPVLIDYTLNGRPLKASVHAGRNGYLWVLNREHGSMGYVASYPFSNNNVFLHIDPKTGRPEVDENKRPGAGKPAEFCPSIGGGKDWPPEAWSPKTQLFYIPANNNLCAYLHGGADDGHEPGSLFTGYPLEAILGSVRVADWDHFGELQAWELTTGRKVWQHNFKRSLWGPLLVTGGDVLFAGGTSDRMFRAFDARTGKVLWEFPAPSGIIAPPSTFMVDGEQYVAVQSGWGLDAKGTEDGIDRLTGSKTVVPQGGTVLVFRLRGGSSK